MAILRLLWRIVGLALVLAFVAVGYIGWSYYAAEPKIEGEVAVEGVSGPVKIIRDLYGVPHIFAARDADVYFGLGYAQAQDRFFQMDLTRRAVEGRLSELIGERGLPVDAHARIRNWNRVIAAQAKALPADLRAAMQAYVKGVNARLAEGRVAGEYALLFVSPEQWTVEDSIACGMALVIDQTIGLDRDQARRQLAGKLKGDLLAQFLQPYPDWAPVIVAEEPKSKPIVKAAAPPAKKPKPPVRKRRDGDEINPGSNSWALAGSRTESGKPLLANDPHISLRAPSTFYLAHLKLKGGDVAGASLPGTPVIVLGRGPHAAWAITNGEIDAEDYVPYPRNAAAKFPTREEEIRVRFGETRRLIVQEAPEGPIADPQYFDVKSFGPDVRVALKSAAADRENKPIEAVFELQRAKDASAAERAAKLMRAPSLNLLLATDKGDIAYALAGRLPARDDAGKWTADLPEDERPKIANPASGQIVSANNKPAASDRLVGSFFPWRAARITELLGARKLDAAAVAEMQRDTLSLPAQRLLPAIRYARPKTKEGQTLQNALSNWDGHMDAAKQEPLIYAAWLRAVQSELIRNRADAGAAAAFDYPRFTFIDAVFNGDAGAWCDNSKTAQVETCGEIAGRAFDAVGASPPVGSSWGEAHAARFANPLLSAIPVIGRMYTVTEPVGGDGSTIDAMHFYGSGDFSSDFGPGYRAVYDLADLNRSRFMLAPGQSGHILSPHYRDLAPLWARGEGIEIAGDWPADKPPEGMTVLTLSPGPKAR
ncbi:MAG TPA: penicillin acylase family protein [Caulobacterales bacterium]|nr:penicillin acylase family protein [Caulobacterales bacterium]